jgi:uncharacterized damage-inducible protein DinB
MNERTLALAERVAQASQALMAAAERCSESEWRRVGVNDARTIGALVHHVAKTHADIIGLAQAVAAGQALPPLTWDMTHQMNAQHGREHADCAKAEALALLRRNTAAAVDAIRGLSDAQLDRTSTWPVDGDVSAQRLIELHIIDHAREHLATITATLERERQAGDV